jgi:hypothetical protein
MTVSPKSCSRPGIARAENGIGAVLNDRCPSVRAVAAAPPVAGRDRRLSLQTAPENAEVSEGYRSRSRSGLATVVTRLLGGGAWSPADLVEIVGSGWRGEADQADGLAALLRRMVPPAELASLGEVWETATASLAAQHGPVTVSAADRLLERWRQLAEERADSWRRPRSQRRKQGRRSVHPSGDLSRVAS